MKEFYSYEEFKKDVNILSKDIKEYNPDCLIGIARGGLTLAHFLGESLNMRSVYTINSIHYDGEKKLDTFEIKNIPDLTNHKKIVLIDDISDSGETLKEIVDILKIEYPEIEIKISTIYYKPTSLVIPDFKVREATKWIVFFWDNSGQLI
jgi:hypoxanthine phosphoribosyltransferase